MERFFVVRDAHAASAFRKIAILLRQWFAVLMAQVDKSILVEHPSHAMYRLVDAVEEYPQFLPWCGGTEVRWRDEETTVATIYIDYMGVKQSFTTENTKLPHREMNLTLQEGPFTHLQGHWRFHALGDTACKIEFRLSYAFSSHLLEKLMAPVFNHIANTFVDAFVARADKLYGAA
jgi:ribosome-associated toxin RatA of RatAB toxin-antitoxin module